MIDIKELRIGSHVLAGGVRAKVIDIHKRCLNSKDYPYQIFVEGISPDDGEKKVVGGLCDKIEPIPLTAALLAEVGFEPVRKALGKPEEEWYKDIEGYPIRVMKGYSNKPGREWSVHIDSWDYDTIGTAYVEYLHQLEGIIYLCTGEELIKGVSK